VENVSDEQLRSIFQGVGSGLLEKEAIADVFAWLSQHEDKNLKEALDGLGLRMLTKSEIENLVQKVIANNKQSVDKMGDKAFGLIMGLVMKEARGRANPAIVSKLLKELLR
jgi:Glu-tRNA(Gln) amidotransferase subunit E-like FAD-binding protein